MVRSNPYPQVMIRGSQPNARIPREYRLDASRIFHSIFFVDRKESTHNRSATLALFDMRTPHHVGLAAILCSLLFLSACHDPARPGKKQGKPINTALLCACKPTHITKDDWRIEFKNGDLPGGEPEQTSVTAILSWPEGSEPGPRTPRSAKELKLYRIPKAYLQTGFFRKSYCDLHLEISETSDRNAPSMTIETPV